MELRNGLRELSAVAERWRLAIGDFAHLSLGADSRVLADVWDKDVWEFQAKSGSSRSCRLFLHSLGKIAVQEMSGKTAWKSQTSFFQTCVAF